MSSQHSQIIIKDAKGHSFIEGDWFDRPLPPNIFMDEMSYPDTSYSFQHFHSKKDIGFKMGYGSGNYGHSNFVCGKNGQITIGKYVVLQGTSIICNLSVIIHDHCMFSWGSLITDSWVDSNTTDTGIRRAMLVKLSKSKNRNLEFISPKPVVIEENVWVGFKAVILPGVRLGKGCVVGCNAIITEDVPPYAVVIGNPARIIKYLEPNDGENVKREALINFV